MTPITRRAFLAQSGAAVATTALFPTSGATVGGVGPNLQFPSAPHERIAIASYPFREFIVGPRDDEKTPSRQTIELKNFPAHVISKFGVNKIEPWSWHFRSTDAKYLEEFRAALKASQAAIVNIAVDGEQSVYAANQAEREKAVAFRKHWIDVAVAVGSPSVRTNLHAAKDSKPDLDRAANSLAQVAEYGASKGVIVNLENDDAVAEDPFFIVHVIEKVKNPWLHANPDFANTLTTGKTEYAYQGIAAMFAHAYSICHVKAMEADEKGQLVHVDMERTFGILKSSHYKGYLSMEFDSPGDPYQGTSALIEKTIQSLS